MCPVCMASAAAMTGGVISMGGITALGMKVLGWKRNKRGDVSDNRTERRKEDGYSDK